MLVDKIDFSLVEHNFDFHRYDMGEGYRSNKPHVLALMDSLEARQGIPIRRWNYYIDPEQDGFKGKDRSPRLEFPSNKDRHETYDHLGFLECLYYFLFGANLPDELIEMFESKLKEGHVHVDTITSSDYGTIRTKVARGCSVCGLSGVWIQYKQEF